LERRCNHLRELLAVLNPGAKVQAEIAALREGLEERGKCSNGK
jgi:hypothetical protein